MCGLRVDISYERIQVEEGEYSKLTIYFLIESSYYKWWASQKLKWKSEKSKNVHHVKWSHYPLPAPAVALAYVSHNFNVIL